MLSHTKILHVKPFFLTRGFSYEKLRITANNRDYLRRAKTSCELPIRTLPYLKSRKRDSTFKVRNCTTTRQVHPMCDIRFISFYIVIVSYVDAPSRTCLRILMCECLEMCANMYNIITNIYDIHTHIYAKCTSSYENLRLGRNVFKLWGNS